MHDTLRKQKDPLLRVRVPLRREFAPATHKDAEPAIQGPIQGPV